MPITRTSIRKWCAEVESGKKKKARECKHTSGCFVKSCLWCGVLAWALLHVSVVNFNYAAMRPRTASKMAEDAGPNLSHGQLRILGNYVGQSVDFIEMTTGKLPSTEWDKFLKRKRLSYSGEVIQQASPVVWAQLEPALPP